MGNIFFMNTHRSNELLSTLHELSHHDYTIWGTANREDSISLTDVVIPQKVAMVIGSEGHGMDEEIASYCDQTLKIAVDERVAHLNAAMAASIFLYHLRINS